MTTRVRLGYVDVPTGQVHYRTVGEGTPLLLLHQSPNSSVMFERAFPPLAAANIRVIAMDTPGYGMSSVPDERPGIETYASVIPALLDALNVQQCAVLGHHTGANTAAEFAIRHPERVTKLILNGPPVFNDEERAIRLERAPHATAELKADGSHLLDRWNRRIAATPNWKDIHAMQRGVVQTLIAGLSGVDWYGHIAAYEHPLFHRITDITVPALILTNTGDDLYKLARRAHHMRPDFDYVELEGGNHDIVDEQAEAWAAAVVKFITA